jgi:hypothetical protein
VSIHVLRSTGLLEKTIGFSPDKKWNHEQTTNQGSTFLVLIVGSWTCRWLVCSNYPNSVCVFSSFSCVRVLRDDDDDVFYLFLCQGCPFPGGT